MNPIFKDTLLASLSGVLTLGYGILALFFLKFWHRSRDRLFAWFATAFFVLMFQRATLGLTRQWSESSLWLYGLRLLAFVLIIIAIVEKNRAAERR
jgi:hypothetical protein